MLEYEAYFLLGHLVYWKHAL